MTWICWTCSKYLGCHHHQTSLVSNINLYVMEIQENEIKKPAWSSIQFFFFFITYMPTVFERGVIKMGCHGSLWTIILSSEVKMVIQLMIQNWFFSPTKIMGLAHWFKYRPKQIYSLLMHQLEDADPFGWGGSWPYNSSNLISLAMWRSRCLPHSPNESVGNIVQ